LFFSVAAFAEQKQSLSITLENVEYLYPLNFFSMRAEGQDALMAYMDIQPANYN
jgi:site-specific DNA-cytosine methylase